MILPYCRGSSSINYEHEKAFHPVHTNPGSCEPDGRNLSSISVGPIENPQMGFQEDELYQASVAVLTGRDLSNGLQVI